MEYMGFILFLWIIGGASAGMFVVDRVASSRSSTLVRAVERSPERAPAHA